MKGSLQGCSPSHPSASMIDGHYYNPQNRKHRKSFGSGFEWKQCADLGVRLKAQV